MKRVYIVHPFQGKEENKKKIEDVCKLLADLGHVPISPVHAFSFLDDNIPKEREKALELCVNLLAVCDVACVCGDWVRSKGCRKEVEAAYRYRLPVVHLDVLSGLNF